VPLINASMKRSFRATVLVAIGHYSSHVSHIGKVNLGPKCWPWLESDSAWNTPTFVWFPSLHGFLGIINNFAYIQ
jgi:hypothetical protein